MYISRVVIVPTCKEADNMAELVRRMAKVADQMEGVTQLFVVDDSPDTKTVDALFGAASSLGERSKLRVDGHRRIGSENSGGLSGAVTFGMRRFRNVPYLAVMDGDLQHPPEMLPGMFGAAELGDIVVASRYRRGGSSGGLDGPLRHVVSRTSTFTAKVLFPRALLNVSDPMTGFFVIRSSAVCVDRLNATGFKILLEVLCRHRSLRPVEVPLRFEERTEGESKGGLINGLRFLRQLVSLRVQPYA